MPENDETTQPIGTEHLREVLKQLEESRIDALRWEAESHKNRAAKLEVTIEGMQWRERYQQLRANGPTKIVEHVPEAKAPNWAAYSSETDEPDELINELRAELEAVRARNSSEALRGDKWRTRAKDAEAMVRGFEAEEGVWETRARNLAKRIHAAAEKVAGFSDHEVIQNYHSFAENVTREMEDWDDDLWAGVEDKVSECDEDETDDPNVLISELRATLGAVRAQRDSYKTRSENLRQRAEAMQEPLRAFEADESVWKDRAEDLAERIKVAHARHGNYADRSDSLGYLADLAAKRVKEWGNE